MRADIILTNGPVYTMDPALPQAEAVALSRNRILAVGSATEIDSLRGRHTRVINLHARPLLPAFTDGHLHFEKLALAGQQLDLSGARSASDVAAAVAEEAAIAPRGQWVRGRGWDRNVWSDTSLPSKAILDHVAPGHAVALDSKDLHSLWVNSQALAAAGITAATADPPGGVIGRQPESAEPSGILLEAATKLVSDVYPAPPLADITMALREATPLLWAEGITSIHQMGDAPDGRTFSALQALEQGNQLRLRVLYYLPRENLSAAAKMGLRSGFGNPRLRVGGVKFFADGALGSHTAWMLEPFSDEPDNRGVPWLEPEQLRQEVGLASQAGLRVAVHALGDRANREVIDAIASVHRQPWTSQAESDLRHRVEHAQLLHPDDIPRLAQLGIVASMQPSHCPSDMIMADQHWGEPRSSGAYAWRSLRDAGVPLVFGSDAPVEPISVLGGIHAAVTRRRADGSPGPDGWHPEQRLNVAEAVYAYTLGAARAAGEAHWRGSITPGKLADLIVLSSDIFAIDPMEIRDTTVELTLFDGQVVHGTA